jgi:hypothetical protein
MKRIGRLWRLNYWHESGCAHCNSDMFEDDLVAWVDDQLTCKQCIDKLKANNPLLKLIMKRKQERHGERPDHIEPT